MSHGGLGKGLGDLMNGDQVAGKSCVVNASASTTTTTTQVAPGRGLTTLVSAHRGQPQPANERKRQVLPMWFFFAADILLLGYVVGITFDAPRPFDLGTILFCAISTGLGCFLALLGIARALE